MRVIHVTSAGNIIYGAVHSLMTLATAQKENGHEISFGTFKGRSFGNEVRSLGWEVREFRVRTKVDPFAIAKMAKHFRLQKADIIHTHLSTSSVNGCLAAKVARVPSVATVHGMSSKWSFVFADHIIGVSEGVKTHLQSQGIDSQRVTAVYNGVEKPSGLPSKQESRRKFGLPESALVFGTVARLTDLKGIQHSLHSFAEISKQLPDSVYALVGDGEGEGRYRELAQSLGVSEKVFFLGYQPEVFLPLSAMDVFLFPSLKEAMGIAVVEAMLCGLPIVSTNVGGLPEVVNSEIGALVEPANPRSMADAALHIVNSNMIDQMGQRAANRAQNLFSISSMYSGVQAVYESLTAGTVKP